MLIIPYKIRILQAGFPNPVCFSVFLISRPVDAYAHTFLVLCPHARAKRNKGLLLQSVRCNRRPNLPVRWMIIIQDAAACAYFFLLYSRVMPVTLPASSRRYSTGFMKSPVGGRLKTAVLMMVPPA